ncbi:unnamed protein product [Phytophthora lilii]|uniref:RNA-directed DNA polymerase n=1 Tax=Phytophthora lilii TaxID=2077276 RepID=A0A9W6TLD0_9STRA|nr:unnamed protein product [Phytophthora lilii]
MPKFKGKRGEDVRQWLFQVETLCRINGHDASNTNETLPSIAGTAMEEPASGWFLFWASRTPAEEETWGHFTQDALAHFAASNYQAVLRQKLRQLRQVEDIEDYNGRSHASIEGPDVARASEEDLTVNEAMLNLLCEDPLVYSRAPLFSAHGNYIQDENKMEASVLLDCGATTVYVSRKFVKNNRLKTNVYTDRTIKIKLGDNKIGEAMLELVNIAIHLQDAPNYPCVAVVFDIPEEFDCVLGMSVFVDVQPDIDWRRRCFKNNVSAGASAVETPTPCGKCSQTIGSGLHRAATSESSSAISRDSCRAVVPETLLENGADTNERPVEDVGKLSKRERKNAKVEAMFTLGVVDSEGVETKYITQKKLRKFLRLPAKDAPEHDFMIVLSNDTIKQIGRDLKRNDEPDNVGSKKAKRFLHTDWDTFKNNPAYSELKELSPEQKTEIDKWVREMISKGLIRPSISPHAAPTFCVRKPVGWRIVHDYRYLNNNTIRQSVPMTRKEDVFDSMASSYYFSCVDLMSAYYQVRMKMDHVKYTAFQAPSGLYEYLVLPMGVSNAPATMHRLTSSLFKNLTHTRSFYDDIYVFTKSKDIDEHLQALRDVLKILKKNKLYVKLSKCVFCAEEIPCLSDFIGRTGVRIDPDKVQTIRDWPVPRTQEQLHNFLGLTGYFQRFCEQYAELTAPLFTQLKKKNQRNSKITISAVQLKNFTELKRRLSETSVLHLPDFFQQMHLHLRTDASQFAVGGVRFQVVDGVERPIAFTSRKMKSAELKYPTQQQELLAIVNALAALRIYCLDKPVMIETDHKSREGIFRQKMANRRLARWYDILAEYQPVFAYLPGAKNGIADALSRRPDLKPETKEFHDLLVPSFNETSYQLRIAEVTSTDNPIADIIAGYAKDKKQYKPYFEDNHLIWYQGSTDEKPRIVVPNVLKLKHRIIAEVHDSNYGGHPGSDQTYIKLRADWYWRRMMRTIKKYITDCENGRRNKPRLSKAPGLMEPLQIPDERWRSISMDFTTDLPDTKRGHNSIWVVVDRLSKRSHFIATTKTVSAPDVATLFIDNIRRLHGIPQDIVSDRDTKFVSGFWSAVFDKVGTKLKMTVAYRAQGDGQTERMNRTLEEYLRCFVSARQDDWDAHLANASLQSTPHTSTSNRRGMRRGQAEGIKFTNHQAVILLLCQEALEDAQVRMADVYDRGRGEQEFKVGDRVYLSTKHLDTAHSGFPNSRKLGPKWIGPYSVVRTVHKHAYEINLPPRLKLHSMV